ncbi:MAG: hypothetical protein EU529_12850 [Promethearchaeota archaeon]|nr:MAG: hypothetical protein EU529_12850 [Candidatus Lokiarchaeota archaeon]
MVGNCNCENIDRCSIIGYLPAGFECPYFRPIDAESKFESTGSKLITGTQKMVPLKTTIKNGVLKVVINKEGKKIPLEIDIQQELDQ